MTETAKREGRRLEDLLTQQRDAYVQLRELAQRQRGAIDSDRPEDLLRILADRQRLITELTEINELLEPYRSRWNEIRDGLPALQRLKVSELVDEVQKLLAGILEQDQGDCDRLKQRSEEVRSGAAAIATGRKLNSAYAGGGYGAMAPKFVDRIDQQG